MEKRTCLYDKHVAAGAKMVPFGGFEMPLQYEGITEEHNAVRTACGVFDVSHMGEVVVTGPDAEAYVQHIFTNDVAGAPKGKIFYGMMLYEDGGTVDDLLVYCLGDNKYLLVINAANIDKDFAWMQAQQGTFDVCLENKSDVCGQLAIQGPQAEAVTTEVLGLNCADLVFYTFKVDVADGVQVVISRTGYTGEDGFEIYGPHAWIVACWDKLMASGRCKPCGLGCRDTLRFEVGLPLYGDELAAEISPIMAGLGIFVKLDKPSFIGREAVAAQKAEGPARKIVGIALEGHAIPRHGYEVMADGQKVGEVTTGYRSISTGQSVCMALVDAAWAKLGTPLDICIHRRLHRGTVVKKKFYDKHYKK